MMNPFLDIFQRTSDAHWMSRAACSPRTAELFFPPKGFNAEDARDVCLRCPVRQECLSHALAADERSGIWGGLSPVQRKQLGRHPARRPGFCVNDHDLTEVGLDTVGGCLQCRRDRQVRYERRRRQGLVAPKRRSA